jgi:hypothetical protein
MNGQAVKKPVKINFFEWENNRIDLLIWVDCVGGKEKQSLFEFDKDESVDCCTIKTLEGYHLCRLGDVIIQGVNGEFYPCKREIFNKTYEISKLADRDRKNRVFGPSILVSAFPGTGKSYCTQHGKNLIMHDSDSSEFHFTTFSDEKRVNPEWPGNYIDHIKRLLSRGYYEIIFISSHAEIREALKDAGLKYLLVCPDNYCKDEYLQRYQQRGSPEAFVERLGANWEAWLKSCWDDEAMKILLGPGTFLTEHTIISNVRPDTIHQLRG